VSIKPSRRECRRPPPSRVWLGWRVEATRQPDLSNNRSAQDRLELSHDRWMLGLCIRRADTSRLRSPWFQPSLGDAVVDKVPLNPPAMRASKEAQVLTRPARLNRRQLHWRTASSTLRTLVLCIEHMRPSVRRSEFTGKPTDRVWFEGIRCSDAYLNVIAFGAFEQPVFETDRARRNAFQHHPHLAAGAARALNCGQELLGRGHGASLYVGGSVTELSVTDSCQWRAVMEPAWRITRLITGQYCSHSKS
jgi:hypothetical protein